MTQVDYTSDVKRLCEERMMYMYMYIFNYKTRRRKITQQSNAPFFAFYYLALNPGPTPKSSELLSYSFAHSAYLPPLNI